MRSLLRLPLVVALVGVLAAGLAAAPASAQTIAAADPAAREVTALGGTIVWVSGTPGQQQVLMQRTSAGIAPVEGAPAARFYRSIDLGRDGAGDLVLTYLRCGSTSRCVVRRDDLHDGRSSIRGLTLPRCSLTTAPALWRRSAAYGLACTTRGNRDAPRRSGVYVKTGSRAPERMPRPREAARFNVSEVTAVDLRGSGRGGRVAAILSDIYSFAVAQNLDGRAVTAFLAAASEGDSDQHAPGLALGTAQVLWSLTTAEHAGDPLRSVVNRLGGGGCREFQALVAAPEQQEFPAVDLTVDGETVYLVVPGVGIVEHEFVPDFPCA